MVDEIPLATLITDGPLFRREGTEEYYYIHFVITTVLIIDPLTRIKRTETRAEGYVLRHYPPGEEPIE